MENRYLCRGKRIDNGEWVQGYLYAEERKCVEVIGNIFDNLELLESKE